jgi:methyltransferase-like protein
MQPTPKTSYDDVPYESFPIQGAHPDRLWTLARLPGISAAAIDTCRVLELGCAGGGNLIPMALELPRAKFTGVDLSGVQIAEGEALIAALGLNNVTLKAMSLMDIDAGFGEFDYIVAHGLYSWVPRDVQEKILDICKRNLAPNGVAYVSYNTLPGWRTRGAVRDLMRYHAMQFPDPKRRVQEARVVLDFLAKGVPAEGGHGHLMRAEVEALASAPDFYLLHEHLDEQNEPLYFHEFMGRAQQHGLQYLADADIATMMGSRFPPQVGEAARRIASDAIRQEQLMDFLTNRTFRQTLLVHAEQTIDRRITPERLNEMWISTTCRPASAKPSLAEGVAEQFSTPSGLSVNSPRALTKAALVTLSARSPATMRFADLLSAAFLKINPLVTAQPAAGELAALAGDMLHAYSVGLVELHAGPSAFTVEPGERPQVSALARQQAQHGTRITTMRHESIAVPEAIRALLPLLDGTRTLDAIAAEIQAQPRDALKPFGEVGKLRAAVGDIARAALVRA